jgi:hypothetical protein
MKKINYLLLGFLAIFSLTAGITYHSGTPGQKSGSPGDGGSTCVQCHGGSAVTPVSGWITTDIPANGYTAGTTYNVWLTAHHAGAVRYGFEMTAEDNANAKKGAFIVTNSVQNQLVFGNSNAITHTGNGITPSNDSITWSFQWTAPATGTGNITLYAAINAANGNNGTSGDMIYTTTASLTELIVTAIDNPLAEELTIYPNPAISTLNVKGLNDDVTSVILINSVGQEVRNMAPNSSELTMDVNNLESGLYFLNIVSAENVRSEKVYVQ